MFDALASRKAHLEGLKNAARANMANTLKAKLLGGKGPPSPPPPDDTPPPPAAPALPGDDEDDDTPPGAPGDSADALAQLKALPPGALDGLIALLQSLKGA